MAHSGAAAVKPSKQVPIVKAMILAEFRRTPAERDEGADLYRHRGQVDCYPGPFWVIGSEMIHLPVPERARLA
jgi:hypothetical protein